MMALVSRVKVLGVLAVLSILILTLSILVVTRAPVRAASQSSCSHTFVPSPNGGTGASLFKGVAAIAPNDAWAVGGASSSSGSNTLTEHWDGTSWSVVASPNPGTNGNSLNAVSAVSSSDVWAVGTFQSSGASQTLTEHWNGTSWSVVASPNVGTGDNVLNGVSAVSSNDVWAVGVADFNTLTEHWNGTSWSVVASPNPGSSFNGLSGVSANATNDVWAVGQLFNSASGRGDQTLTEHWNGVSWSVVKGVDFGSISNQFFGVTTIAHNDVWAVGNFENTGNNPFFRPLIEHWDGRRWSVVANPAANHTGFGGDLDGVAATNSRRVWTAGDSFSNTTDQTLTERWTPHFGWRVLTNPTIGTFFSLLDAVSAVKATSGPAVVWAVGYFANSAGPVQTLTELIVC